MLTSKHVFGTFPKVNFMIQIRFGKPEISPFTAPSDSKLVVWLALVNQDFWDPPGTKA